MTFEVTILGSSSAIPTRERFPSAQVINYHGRFFLMDCGEGAQIQLIRAGIGLQKIEKIFISHLHGDHFFGLPGLLSSMHLVGRESSLDIYAAGDLEKLVMPLVSYSHDQLGFNVNFYQLDEEQQETVYEDDQLLFRTVFLEHGLSAWGFVFQEKKKERNIRKDFVAKYQPEILEIKAIKQGADYTDKQGELHPNNEITTDPPEPRGYAYCSDTKYFPELSEAIRPANTLYHESSYTDDEKELAARRNHSTSSQAARIAKDAGCKKLILGHFSARYRNLDELMQQARDIFPESYAAADLKRFTIL